MSDWMIIFMAGVVIGFMAGTYTIGMAVLLEYLVRKWCK